MRLIKLPKSPHGGSKGLILCPQEHVPQKFAGIMERNEDEDGPSKGRKRLRSPSVTISPIYPSVRMDVGPATQQEVPKDCGEEKQIFESPAAPPAAESPQKNVLQPSSPTSTLLAPEHADEQGQLTADAPPTSPRNLVEQTSSAHGESLSGTLPVAASTEISEVAEDAAPLDGRAAAPTGEIAADAMSIPEGETAARARGATSFSSPAPCENEGVPPVVEEYHVAPEDITSFDLAPSVGTQPSFSDAPPPAPTAIANGAEATELPVSHGTLQSVAPGASGSIAEVDTEEQPGEPVPAEGMDVDDNMEKQPFSATTSLEPTAMPKASLGGSIGAPCGSTAFTLSAPAVSASPGTLRQPVSFAGPSSFQQTNMEVEASMEVDAQPQYKSPRTAVGVDAMDLEQTLDEVDMMDVHLGKSYEGTQIGDYEMSDAQCNFFGWPSLSGLGQPYAPGPVQDDYQADAVPGSYEAAFGYDTPQIPNVQSKPACDYDLEEVEFEYQVEVDEDDTFIDYSKPPILGSGETVERAATGDEGPHSPPETHGAQSSNEGVSPSSPSIQAQNPARSDHSSEEPIARPNQDCTPDPAHSDGPEEQWNLLQLIVGLQNPSQEAAVEDTARNRHALYETLSVDDLPPTGPDGDSRPMLVAGRNLIKFLTLRGFPMYPRVLCSDNMSNSTMFDPVRDDEDMDKDFNVSKGKLTGTHIPPPIRPTPNTPLETGRKC